MSGEVQDCGVGRRPGPCMLASRVASVRMREMLVLTPCLCGLGFCPGTPKFGETLGLRRKLV